MNGSEPGAVRLVDVEISRPIRSLRPVGDYEQVRILVRLHGRPLGTVSLELLDGAMDGGLLAVAVWDHLGDTIRRHCAQDDLAIPEKLTAEGLGGPGEMPCSWRRSVDLVVAPLATVVVTTCGGPERRLLATVRDLLAQSYPRFEVVVVDNRPATSGVSELLASIHPADSRLRYAREPQPGLSHARNRGAAVARGDLIAFTDDDVEIDPDWLACLVAGFADSRVACVTGLILPLELETPAQRLLEEFGGYTKGFEHRVWDCGEHRLDSPLYPYTVGVFGSGANAAFRACALADLGGFDGVLGTGTPSRGGEDIDIYVTCVQRGYRITYEPGAIIRHAHLREMDQVRQKVRDYGVGLGAMLTKHLLTSWSTAGALLARVPTGTVHLLSSSSPKNASRSGTYPPALILAELQGLAYGPVAYVKSRASS